MSETQIQVPDGVPFIDVSREFEAPRDLVFRAFTEPDLLVQWLGPGKYEMVIDTYDVRAGGSWRYIHRDGDGNEYGFHGVFHGDPSPDGFVQTFEFEGAPGHVSLDKLSLEEREGKTTVHTHSVYQSLEARNAMVESGMAEGMNEGFNRLDALLERLATLAPVH
ncbi:MAG: SRPBCC family protein [Chloroflexi bacterium]|nr:SRPBCC family protein [Chloroflexota bacterium]